MSVRLGDMVGIFNSSELYVPPGYTSGDVITSGSAQFYSQTFASMGLTEGNYVWTWGSGGNTDSLTFQIGAVPEPSSTIMLGIGALGIITCRRRIRY